MASRNRFMADDIPYDKLRKLGITPRNTLSMPKELLESFLSGRVTPLVQARVRSRSGNYFEIPMKLQLVRDRKGRINLLTYPVRAQIENSMRLNQNEIMKLKDGNVIRKEVNENGVRRMQFVQMDRQTKSLLRRNASNLKLSEQMAQLESVKDIQLGQNQKDAIKEGKPVELTIGDQKVTVGVDNKEPTGFKVVNGDMDEWNKQQKIKFDLSNEGFMGYVMTDENRWEYKQVVDKLENRELNRERKVERQEQRTRSTGIRM